MGWFLFLLLAVIGIAVFTWGFRRRLDVLTGPWITEETARHD
jgi:hypothetical protein